MKLLTVFLSGLLITLNLIALDADHGVYYAEFKALKEAPETKSLFEQDVDGGSYTTQCNLLKYGSTTWFSQWNDWRRTLSLGNIKRQIMVGKKLSFIDSLLILELCDQNDDLIMVTHETMPALYDYVCSLSKDADIVTPFIFVTLREGFFSAFSRKIFAFKGSIVIGQQLLHDISDVELEALVAQEIGHIKYNHTNKAVAVVAGFIGLTGFTLGVVLPMLKEKDLMVHAHRVARCTAALSPLLLALFNKHFEEQADIFVSKVAEKSTGLVKFYERLQERDEARVAEFDEISTMLSDNSLNISSLLYIRLLALYYCAKAEHCVTGIYNKFAYPTHQERIDVAKKYLETQQEAA